MIGRTAPLVDGLRTGRVELLVARVLRVAEQETISRVSPGASATLT